MSVQKFWSKMTAEGIRDGTLDRQKKTRDRSRPKRKYKVQLYRGRSIQNPREIRIEAGTVRL
jgi:hypothetical protein